MKALILDAPAHTASVGTIPVPQPGPGEVLVRVHAIALNPVDALYTSHPLGQTGRVVGTDFAGVVEALSPSSDGAKSTTLLAIGDRVAGFVQGACSANDRPGAAAEFVVTPADLVWKVPQGISFEQAASVSLCGLTAAQGLFYRLGLEAPFAWAGAPDRSDSSKDPLAFFIYGASTSVGLYAAQLVRRSAEASGRRLTLVGAASERHWPMLRATPYGFDHLVDYRGEDWAGKVRELSGRDGVDFAYDAISEGDTVINVAKTLRPGGKMAIVRSREAGAWRVDESIERMAHPPVYGAVWEGLGVDIEYHKFVVRTSPSKRAFATAFYAWLSSTSGSNGEVRLAPNPIRLMPGGLERIVPDGFALMGGNVGDRKVEKRTEEWMRPVSGEKLVYRIGDE